jgi:LysR family hydrogen peroxide-inducible transcriptional activator
MVASNMGITLLPKLATLNPLSNKDIRYIPFSQPEPIREISLLCRSGYARMDCVRAVATSVRESVMPLFKD